MWEILAKIIPPPLLLGLLVYALVCFFWLQPTAEERMAGAYIAQCEAGHLPVIAKPTPAPTIRKEADGDVLPSVDVPVSVQVLKELRSLLQDEVSDVALPYETAGSACGCAVSRSFDRVFWPHYLHVASLGSYTPRSIRHLDQYVAREMAAGSCAGR